MTPQSLPRRPSAQGFSIAELLVALAIGMLILAGMTTLFVRNSRTQTEVERANRQIENGRYAVQLLSTDLRNAGYYGEFDPTPLADPPGVPDPCSPTLPALRAALPLHVQGFAPGDALPSCLTDVKPGTAVLVVRHTRTCASGNPDCDADGIQGPLFQASLCDNLSELGSGDPANYYALDTDPAKLTRHQRDCTATAGTGTVAIGRRFLTHIYFVANNDQAGDGIATLKRAELRVVNGTLQFIAVPLVEGIDDLELEYGIDTNGDGVVDQYTASPGGAAGWRNVLTVRVSVLARNLDKGGSNQRHAFQSTVLMPNPAGRKQP
ncbi:PilW family protein [Massilia sp. LXY-6]|uniref:PilW family protein n=1 Tax=Massilia sp. LXY-6 TaxID=3379823 RepID=UPI003EDED080